MFSGKTEGLIRVVRRALCARRKAQVFKHAFEARSPEGEIRSHGGRLHEAATVSTSGELLGKVEKSTDVVAVEEVRFFD